MKALKAIVLIIMVIILMGCSANNTLKSLKAENGIMDLTETVFDEKKVVNLDGRWEFYWDRFLSFNDFHKDKPDAYLPVPGVWNGHEVSGKKLPGQGHATYRLQVRTSFPEGTALGLRPYSFSSAYRLYVNDKLIASNGTVSSQAHSETGEYKPQAVFFNTPGKEFDIIIHVSNHQYARGGFWYSMSMGSAVGILANHDFNMGKEIFLLGSLIMLALFYLAVYFLQRELKYSLYFSCLCFSIAIALDMVGQFILPRIFPGMAFRTIILIWYMSIDWVVLSFILYVHELFKSRFSTAVARIYFSLTIIFALIYILAPSTVFTRLADLSNFIQAIGILCVILIIFIGIRKGYKDGWLNVISMLVMLIASIHDMLFWTNRIEAGYGEIIYLGLFLFILIQMIIQANRIKYFHDSKTAAELSFLQAQIKPHFLYNSLNTFVSISRYDVEQARQLLVNFSNYLRRSFDFKDLSQFVPLKNEIELAKAYIEIEKARFEERLEVNFEVCEEMELKVPILILQPVIENAINHGVLPRPEGGKVDITVSRENNVLTFKVKDNGVGMTLSKEGYLSKHEFGRGVGLSNIDGRLRKLYGKGLLITSSLDEGTEITWHIPIDRRRSE